MRRVYGIILVFLTVCVASCGGGGGSVTTPSSSSVTFKLVTSGSLTSNLAGMSVTIRLPVGVTVATDGSGIPLASVVTPSGMTANAASIPPSFMTYAAPTGSAPGSLNFVLASSAAPGFATGEFATVTVSVAHGSSAPSGTIATADFKPVDVLGNTVTGLTTTIQ